MPRKNKASSNKQAIIAENRDNGIYAVRMYSIFSELWAQIVDEADANLCPHDGWGIVTSHGVVHLNPYRLGTPEEWSYVYAHCLLHLAFGHFKVQKYQQKEWNIACDCYIARFLEEIKLGQPPVEMSDLLPRLKQAGGFSLRSEEQLFEELCTRGLPTGLLPSGTAGSHMDMYYETKSLPSYLKKVDWQKNFAHGLSTAVEEAVDTAAGLEEDEQFRVRSKHMTEAQRARSWFLSHYPLLGVLAASFKIIEDPLLCHRMQISVAAINMQMREIYVNPHARLEQEELRFVMAHELLHAGLRHDVRCGGRDPYYWNVACDYVINAWLLEMGVGSMPEQGLLYDPALKGESAEAIYDRIVADLRRYRKLSTLRGVELGDILGEPGWWASSEGTDLDEFYRSCLSQGLMMHQDQGRGYISAGLIEEINALSQPPIPWDVELAQWFDHFFTPLEKVRTYTRLSRRQSSTPDIPRPLWVPDLPDDNRTFGVVLDTSGSMNRVLLAKALGTIASYSIARDVTQVRVVFCDAATFDQGYMAPEDIAGSVKVRGRGGTILQPGIDLLENAHDFPKEGPLLIITDAQCDRLMIRREHAFLVPVGRYLPFPPRGPVFRMH